MRRSFDSLSINSHSLDRRTSPKKLEHRRYKSYGAPVFRAILSPDFESFKTSQDTEMKEDDGQTLKDTYEQADQILQDSIKKQIPPEKVIVNSTQKHEKLASKETTPIKSQQPIRNEIVPQNNNNNDNNILLNSEIITDIEKLTHATMSNDVMMGSTDDDVSETYPNNINSNSTILERPECNDHNEKETNKYTPPSSLLSIPISPSPIIPSSIPSSEYPLSPLSLASSPSKSLQSQSQSPTISSKPLELLLLLRQHSHTQIGTKEPRLYSFFSKAFYGEQKNNTATATSTTKNNNNTRSTTTSAASTIQRRTLLRYQVQRVARNSPQGNRSAVILLAVCNSKETALRICQANAPPVWMGIGDMCICSICQHESALMRQIHHCRNCGVYVCNFCSSKAWPASMVPATYHNNQRTVRVCDSCHYLMTTFAGALEAGDVHTALSCYDTGNVNLYCPFTYFKMANYPVHCAAAGGNVDLLAWLIGPMMCCVRDSVTGRAITNSMGQSVLAVAASRGHIDIMRLLIKDYGMQVTDITSVQDLWCGLHVALDVPGPLPTHNNNSNNKTGSYWLIPSSTSDSYKGQDNNRGKGSGKGGSISSNNKNGIAGTTEVLHGASSMVIQSEGDLRTPALLYMEDEDRVLMNGKRRSMLHIKTDVPTSPSSLPPYTEPITMTSMISSNITEQSIHHQHEVQVLVDEDHVEVEVEDHDEFEEQDEVEIESKSEMSMSSATDHVNTLNLQEASSNNINLNILRRISPHHSNNYNNNNNNNNNHHSNYNNYNINNTSNSNNSDRRLLHLSPRHIDGGSPLNSFFGAFPLPQHSSHSHSHPVPVPVPHSPVSTSGDSGVFIMTGESQSPSKPPSDGDDIPDDRPQLVEEDEDETMAQVRELSRTDIMQVEAIRARSIDMRPLRNLGREWSHVSSTYGERIL
eukprot:gene8854-18344_t